MRRADVCIVCGSPNLRAFPSKVAPFLADYVWGSDSPAACHFMTCARCTVAFYDCRLDSAEVQALYSGYRGTLYASTREKHEPGYLAVNEVTGKGDEVTARKRNLEDVLAHAASPHSVARVLDYGGDAGQFIPDRYENSLRFVYDLAATSPAPGIETVRDPAAHAPYDFVMCAHVLEHASDPIALVEELARLMGDAGLIYLEVPWDPYYFHQRFRYLRYPRWQPPAMHEHLTFFTATALRYLAVAVGLRRIYCGIRHLDIGWGRTRVVSMLASRGAASAPRGFNRALSIGSDFATWLTSRAANKLGGWFESARPRTTA